MLVHRRVTPSIRFAGTHLYTWVERGTVRVKCLAQEHNTMSPARTRTRTTRSGVKHTDHEAIAPPEGSEVCQHVIGQVLEGWHNARNIADDILVHSTTREEHDRSLENVLLRLQDKNLTVNSAKFHFYIHGSQFDLVGDHKPLEVLLNGRGNPSPRIERW